MIRQDADRDGLKWAALLSSSIAMTEAIDFADQQITAAVRESDREKENAAFGSTVLRHSALSKGRGGHGARAPLPTLRHSYCAGRVTPHDNYPRLVYTH
jgi:hypothetical protein